MVINRRGTILVTGVSEAYRSLLFEYFECLELANRLNRNVALVHLLLGFLGLDSFLVKIGDCVP